MIIIHDAKSYNHLGNILHTQGWAEYLKTGPNREPLYPLLISISMNIGENLSISYQTIQIFFQLFFLFLTQHFSIRLLKKLKINNFLISLNILYLGFSPAMTNSAFRLYSEIFTFPIILLILSLTIELFFKLKEENYKPFLIAFLIGFCFCLLTFIKGITELIAPIFLFTSFLLLLIIYKKENKSYIFKILICLLITLLTFYIPVILYKQANKKYNGHFTLTNRGPWALYGNTTRRMQPLTSNRIKSALAYVPGWGFCESTLGKNSCKFWSYSESDNIGATKRNELESNGYPSHIVDQMLIKLSVKKAIKNPFQYILFMLIESQKMVFWDSFEIGFVVFPEPVAKFYNIKILKMIMFICIPFFTYSSIIYLLIYIIKNKKFFFKINEDYFEKHIILFLVLFFIISYSISYSFFYILPRYSFPLAPLYLIIIAFMLNNLLLKLRT